jgi:hypothetical protein
MLRQVADRFFNGYQLKAYLAMKSSGLWKRFAKGFEVYHTQGLAYNLEDAERILKQHGYLPKVS